MLGRGDRVAAARCKPAEAGVAVRDERLHAEFGGERQCGHELALRVHRWRRARRANLGEKTTGVGLVSTLLLLGREREGVGCQAFGLSLLTGQQVDLAAFDDQQRQPAQPAHRSGPLNCCIEVRQPFGDAAAARVRDTEVGGDRRAQQRHLLTHRESAREWRNRRFELADAHPDTPQSEARVAKAVRVPRCFGHPQCLRGDPARCFELAELGECPGEMAAGANRRQTHLAEVLLLGLRADQLDNAPQVIAGTRIVAESAMNLSQGYIACDTGSEVTETLAQCQYALASLERKI